MEAKDEIEVIIENAIGELYRGLFRLRQTKQYKREYETMGIVMDMLGRDRINLLQKYGVEFDGNL